MKDTIKYTLIRPFSYAYQGEAVEAQFIELREPTSHNLSEVGALRQGVVQAIRAVELTRQETESSAKSKAEAPDEPEDVQANDQEESGITANDVISILASSPVDLAKIYNSARHLILSKNIARVDGQEKMTLTLFEKMSARDVEMMIGTYIASFILAS